MFLNKTIQKQIILITICYVNYLFDILVQELLRISLVIISECFSVLCSSGGAAVGNNEKQGDKTYKRRWLIRVRLDLFQAERKLVPLQVAF